MKYRTETHNAYTLTDDPTELDMDLAHRALSQDSYWASGRTWEVHAQAVANSRVAVALTEGGATAGFARAVTDGVTFAWLCDVWVEPEHRGCGLGLALAHFLVDAPDLADVRRWTLVTRDAHEIYRRLGFTPLPDPTIWMERRSQVH